MSDSIYSLLAGSMPGGQDYLAEDPFYAGGVGFARQQIQPKNNSEAIWAPLIQGLLSGGMMGYGESSAKQKEWDAAKVSKLLSGQSGFDSGLKYEGEMPDDFKLGQTRKDAIYAALAKQEEQATALKKLEIQGELDKQYANHGIVRNSEGKLVVDPNYASARGELSQQEALGKYLGERGVRPGADAPMTPASALTPEKIAELEQKYTNTLLTGQQAQSAIAINRAASNIFEALKENSPLAASTAIFEYAKLQDEKGTVREGDEMRVSDPGGPLGYLARLHNIIVKKGKLTPDVKREMSILVPRLQKNTFAGYDALRDSLFANVEKYGGKRDMLDYVKATDLNPLLASINYGDEEAPPTGPPPGLTYEQFKAWKASQ